MSRMLGMSGVLPLPLKGRHQPIAWFAIVCLLSGWVHVWQHQAAHDDGDEEEGHFEHELGDLCQLANDPWSIVPLVPCAEQAAPALQLVVPTPTGVVDARPAMAPSIRAPPVA